MTARDFSMEWRTAVLIAGRSPKPAALALDQPVRDQAQKRPERLRRRRRFGIFQAIGDVYQGLVGFLTGQHAANYLDCQKAQQIGEVACVEGQGFRLLIGGHRLFLQVDGDQHAFDLRRPATPAGTS